jgi:hypothetical protein
MMSYFYVLMNCICLANKIGKSIETENWKLLFLLLRIKFVFSRNSYVSPIFIFVTEQALIYFACTYLSSRFTIYILYSRAKHFFMFFGGQECVSCSFAYVSCTVYEFWGMSGFEPRELAVTSMRATNSSKIVVFFDFLIHA